MVAASSREQETMRAGAVSHMGHGTRVRLSEYRVRNIDGRRGRVANVAGVHGTYVHTCPAHIFPLSGLLSVALR